VATESVSRSGDTIPLARIRYQACDPVGGERLRSRVPPARFTSASSESSRKRLQARSSASSSRLAIMSVSRSAKRSVTLTWFSTPIASNVAVARRIYEPPERAIGGENDCCGATSGAASEGCSVVAAFVWVAAAASPPKAAVPTTALHA
jgi:hypothetical protein